MELIEKFADNKLLSEDNIVPRQSLSDILNDNYEITTFFGPEKVDKKINVEIALIEEELERSLTTTKTNIKEFQETLKQYSPKLSLERYWSSSATLQDELLKLDNLLHVIDEIEELYGRTNTYSKSLSPILRTGGYRSLLLCLNESLARINQPLEAALKKNNIGGSGGVQRRKSFLSSFRNESLRRLRADSSKEQSPPNPSSNTLSNPSSNTLSNASSNTLSNASSNPLLHQSREEPSRPPPSLCPRKPSHRRSRSHDYKNKQPPGEDGGGGDTKAASFSKPSLHSSPLSHSLPKKYRSKHRKTGGKEREEKEREEMKEKAKEEMKGEMSDDDDGKGEEYSADENEREEKGRIEREEKGRIEREEKGRIESASAPSIRNDGVKKRRKERREKGGERKEREGIARKREEESGGSSGDDLPPTASSPSLSLSSPSSSTSSPSSSTISYGANGVGLRRSVQVEGREREGEEQPALTSLQSKLQLIDRLIGEGALTADQFLHSKSSLERFLSSERDRIKHAKEEERERLKQKLKELDREEKEELHQLDKAVKRKMKALEERVEGRGEVKTAIGANSKLFRLVCIRCAKSFDLLENLKGKLIVCTSIALGSTFLDLDSLYSPHPHIDRNSVFARHHFGYELNRDLREYSKKMKVVYCAVADSRYPDKKEKEAAIKGLIKQMYFSWAAVKYSLSSKSASDQYGDLRANLDVNFVKDVWDLLEDPLTNFFATQFGFAAAMERMKINADVRIPVPASDIFDVALPEYTHNQPVKRIEGGEEERKGGRNGEKTYRIRCRFISLYANEVDPSLVLKSLKSRTNFVEEFTAEVPPDPPKLKRRSLLLSSSSSSVDPLAEPHEALLQNAIVLHIHGGGWVSQSPDQHLPYVSEWGKYAQLPVLSIDYSLSPESQYPIPVNECFAIYKWLQEPSNLKKLGLPSFKEPIRIILCGDSAGGNLSCATTIRAIQEKVRLPIGLLLHYPAINLTETGSLSRLIFSNDPILNYETMRVVLGCYLGSQRAAADVQPLMSPGLASDEILSKFPSTVICVGDVDPLIDDSTFLFSRLQSLGVNAILKVYRALPHGFLNLPTQLPKARKAIAEAGVYLEWLFKEYLERLAFEEELKKNSKVTLSATPRFIDATHLRFRSSQNIGDLVPNLKELVDTFDSDDYDEIEDIPAKNNSL